MRISDSLQPYCSRHFSICEDFSPATSSCRLSSARYSSSNNLIFYWWRVWSAWSIWVCWCGCKSCSSIVGMTTSFSAVSRSYSFNDSKSTISEFFSSRAKSRAVWCLLLVLLLLTPHLKRVLTISKSELVTAQCRVVVTVYLSCVVDAYECKSLWCLISSSKTTRFAFTQASWIGEKGSLRRSILKPGELINHIAKLV